MQPVDEPRPGGRLHRPGDRAGADLAPRARLDAHRPQHVEPGDQVPPRVARGAAARTPPRRLCSRCSCCAAPQTVGELKGRTERQHRFDSIDEVGAVLTALAGRDDPLVLPARTPTRPEGRPLGAPAGAVRRAPAARGDRGPCRRRRHELPRRNGATRTGRRPPSSTTCSRPRCGTRSACRCSTCWPASIPPTGRSSTSAAAPGSGWPTCAPRSPARGWSRSSRRRRCVSRCTRALSEFTELREQTTVIPTIFGEAPLPERGVGDGAVGTDRSPVRRRAHAAVVVHRRAHARRARRS